MRNESASGFGCLHEPIVVEGECIKLCSVKLDNIVPMAHGKTIHAVQKIASKATSVLAACSCEVKTAFPDVEKLHN